MYTWKTINSSEVDVHIYTDGKSDQLSISTSWSRDPEYNKESVEFTQSVIPELIINKWAGDIPVY